jgi:acetyl-CoA carboxylase biotin carboxylase subunit
MLRALSEYRVYGIKTTIPFFKRILLHPKFFAGNYNTHFIANLGRKADGRKPEEEVIALIAAGVKVYSERKSGSRPQSKRKESSWKFQGRLKNFANRL